MKRIFLALIIGCFSLSVSADETQAVEASSSWLVTIDQSNYAKSWFESAPFFQSQITEEKWAKAAESARKPLGKLLNRKLSQAEAHSSLLGAPDGEYYVIVYSSAFENNAHATETVTVVHAGEEWKAVGYFIK